MLAPNFGCIFIGENGKIEINRDKIAANPSELLTSADYPGPLTVPENEPHIRNWIERIKDRGRCNADIEYGQRSSTICYLVNVVRQVGQVGKPLKWDPAAERFVTHPLGCDCAGRALCFSQRGCANKSLTCCGWSSSSKP